MLRSLQAALIASGVALGLSACAAASPSPTPSPAASASPSPTIAVTASPAPLPTVLAPAPTATLDLRPQLACELNWQSPVNGVKLEPRTDFTVQWDVTNTGAATWEPGTVDFVFAGGTRMFLDSPIPLKAAVAPGQTVTLAAEMKALRNTSSYITGFALRRGDALFCNLGIKIFVQTDDPPQ